MRELNDLFQALSRSTFRSRFKLRRTEADYLRAKGMETVMQHARDFIEKRLAPAEISNDGKQTPMGNHPVFIAQHATATCCRGCLEKWHQIAKGRKLTEGEIDYVLAVIRAWLERAG